MVRGNGIVLHRPPEDSDVYIRKSVRRANPCLAAAPHVQHGRQLGQQLPGAARAGGPHADDRAAPRRGGRPAVGAHRHRRRPGLARQPARAALVRQRHRMGRRRRAHRHPRQPDPGRRRAHPRPYHRQPAGHQRPRGIVQHRSLRDRRRPRPDADLRRRRPRARTAGVRVDADERRSHRFRGPHVVRPLHAEDRAARPADRFGHAGGQARRRMDLQLDVGLRAGRGAPALPGHRGRDADPLRLRRPGVRLLPAAAVLPRRPSRAEHPRHDRLRPAGTRHRPAPCGAARTRPAVRRARPDQHRRVAVHRHRHAGVDPRRAGRRRRGVVARLLCDQGGRGRRGRGGRRRPGAGVSRLRRQHLRGLAAGGLRAQCSGGAARRRSERLPRRWRRHRAIQLRLRDPSGRPGPRRLPRPDR